MNHWQIKTAVDDGQPKPGVTDGGANGKQNLNKTNNTTEKSKLNYSILTAVALSFWAWANLIWFLAGEITYY